MAGLALASAACLNQVGVSPAAKLRPIEAVFGRAIVSKQYQQVALKEGEAAYRTAMKVLKLSNVTFVIAEAGQTSCKWGDTAPDGSSVYTWQFGDAAGGKMEAPPAYHLRHEIGHAIFIELVPSTKVGQYGGDAPDWLDEMAAIAFDSDDVLNDRRTEVVELLRERSLIPLPRLFDMSHPELSTNVKGQRAPTAEITVFEPQSPDTSAFYATASAFHDYLKAKTGNEAILSELVSAFRARQPLDRWILRRLGQHADVEALNVDFHRWLAQDSRYAGKPS